ncbi:iron chelate uptake ABC transporter family permease subunit [Cerasicoccus maritimus]|uniref:metal ABC transporter permease n=1 Tax=Cerasicoccus maritimus TaxID=490089 RepID=UPI0031B82962
MISTTVLGLASGLVGCFLLLRKRSLMGDALSHACLPGIGLAFIVMTQFMGLEGKNLSGLLLGATITGIIGVVLVMMIRNTSRIKDDAAMGIVLSVFFGLGTVVLTLVQQSPGYSAAGLESFIYGKTASITQQDADMIQAVAAVVFLCSVLLFKEFKLLCFDEGFSRSQGWPVNGLDVILLALVTLVTVVGLQAVGLILIIAFLITPAAAARFWTNDLTVMVILSAIIGSISGWLGATLSALLPRLPAGAVIVLVAAMIFMFSMFFGSARGVVRRWLSMYKLKRKIGRQHLLRAVFEIQEALCLEQSKDPANVAVPFKTLLNHRSWTPKRVRQLLRQADHEDHIDLIDGDNVRLSESGFGEAARITRNHRLWEIFLITHADIAASHVDRDADSVEHVLSPDMVRELEEKLDMLGIPESPHYIAQAARGGPA